MFTSPIRSGLCFQSWFSSQLLGIWNSLSKKKKNGLDFRAHPHLNHKGARILCTDKVEYTLVALVDGKEVKWNKQFMKSTKKKTDLIRKAIVEEEQERLCDLRQVIYTF